MKLFIIVSLLFTGFSLGAAFAQVPPTPSAEVQQVLTQIHQVGCNAEEQASANTIAQLQKENAALKAQLQKLDPPKSGATKR